MISSYEVSVRAGFPSPALDYQESRISLDEQFIRHPLSTFVVQCTGDSMIGAFIPPRAHLVIDRSLTPHNGDIVLAEINGEFTVKILKKNDFKCWLVPTAIYLSPGSQPSTDLPVARKQSFKARNYSELHLPSSPDIHQKS